jgi:hypothetical protein
LDGGTNHLTKRRDSGIGVQQTKFVQRKALNLERRMEWVKRIVRWNNYTGIEWRRINALVRTEAARLFGSTNEEAIVKL